MVIQAQTWVQQNTNYPAASIMPIDVHAVNASVAWTYVVDGSCGGINLQQYSRTSNGGTNWTRVPLASLPETSNEFGYTTIKAVAGNTVWFGSDLGRVVKFSLKGLYNQWL